VHSFWSTKEMRLVFLMDGKEGPLDRPNGRPRTCP
jgi:hypothetical protein